MGLHRLPITPTLAGRRRRLLRHGSGGRRRSSNRFLDLGPRGQCSGHRPVSLWRTSCSASLRGMRVSMKGLPRSDCRLRNRVRDPDSCTRIPPSRPRCVRRRAAGSMVFLETTFDAAQVVGRRARNHDMAVCESRDADERDDRAHMDA